MLKERKGVVSTREMRPSYEIHLKRRVEEMATEWKSDYTRIHPAGYIQPYEFMNHIEKEGCRKWPLKGKQITGRGIFSVVLTRRGYTGHRTQL